MLKDERNEARSIVIALDGMKPKEIDLCELHDKELITPLRELIGEVGQPAGTEQLMLPTGGSDLEKKDCPQCPPGRSLTREGLRGHMRKIHGMERTAANEVVRDTFGGTTRTRKPFSEQCPECKAEGVDILTSTYDTPQGLGAHRKSAHGVDGSGRTDK